MKKNLFLLGLAVAAMTSCTNDEVVEMKQPTQKAIGFESFVNKGTRAVTPTTNDIIKFYAYGYYGTGNDIKSLWTNGVAVGRTDNTSTSWSYYTTDDKTNQRFWTKNTYQFGAYANANTSDAALLGVTFDEGTSTVELVIPNYTVNDANDLVADIVTCDNSNLSYRGTVNFSFKHLLTKVKFIVKNNDNKYKMRITGALVVNGANKTGTCVVRKNPNVSANGQAYSEWNVSESSVIYNPFFPTLTDGVSSSDGYIAVDGTVESDEFFVLPQKVENITFSIQATFYDDANQVVAVKDLALKPILVDNNDGKWKEGTYYKYTISLPTSAKPIEFGQIGVGGWTETPIELNNETDPDIPTPDSGEEAGE